MYALPRAFLLDPLELKGSPRRPFLQRLCRDVARRGSVVSYLSAASSDNFIFPRMGIMQVLDAEGPGPPHSSSGLSGSGPGRWASFLRQRLY
jgi:hypothetical protein